MSRVPWFPKTRYMIAVQAGPHTRQFYYGDKLKDAMDAAGLTRGDVFSYVKFDRGKVFWAEVTASRGGKVQRYLSAPFIGADTDS